MYTCYVYHLLFLFYILVHGHNGLPLYPHYVEFFSSAKLQSGYVDERMSPEPPPTKWPTLVKIQLWVNYPFNPLPH